MPGAKSPESAVELDERLLATPPLALSSCRTVACEMSEVAITALKKAMAAMGSYSTDLVTEIREAEEQTDQHEDSLGTYLVKLSAKSISEADSREAAMLLKVIGDFERISDHGVNIVESVEELRDKGIEFSSTALNELNMLFDAVSEILDLTYTAFSKNDLNAAHMVEPLEQVIDKLKEELRSRHILRLQQGMCTIDAGFIWSDLITNLERTSDHCSNIAGGIIDLSQSTMNIHESLRAIKSGDDKYKAEYEQFSTKYSLV